GGAISVRVRVAVMALFRVGSFFTLRVEALPAATGGPVVRVAHEESAACDTLRVVNARAVEVVLALPVDKSLETMDLDDLIAILDLPVQRKTVPEPRASTAGHVHPAVRVLRGPQRLTRLRVVPLDELLDLVRSRFCERDLNHRHSPCLPKKITPLFNPLRTVFATLNRTAEVHFSGFPMYRRSARKPRLSYTWRARSFPSPTSSLIFRCPRSLPIACPVDKRLADALVPVIRRDPDVIEERVRLRRQEPA